MAKPVFYTVSEHPQEKHIGPEVPAIEAMQLMEDHAITVLPVVDENLRPISAIHMHELVKAGLTAWPTRGE